MIQLFATLQVLGARTFDYLDDQIDVVTRVRDERGSVTIEQVLWAVAVIAIAGGVILAVTTFVKNKTSEIK